MMSDSLPINTTTHSSCTFQSQKSFSTSQRVKTRRFAQFGELMPLLTVLTDNRLLEGHTYLESHPTLAGERVSGSPTWGQAVAFTLASRRLTLHGKHTWRAGGRGQTGVTVGSHTHGPRCAYPRRKMMKKKEEEEKRASWCKCPQARTLSPCFQTALGAPLH